MELTKLGNPKAKSDRAIEAFPIADTTQVITLDCAEFTCRCPITGPPDWATVSGEGEKPVKRLEAAPQNRFAASGFRQGSRIKP